MAYEPLSFAGFGRGLNLRDKVDAISEEEAIDCLNTEFTERGAVKQRPGYAPLTTGVPRTNLVTNPRATVDTAGWTNTGLTTFARVTLPDGAVPTVTAGSDTVATAFHQIGNGANDRATFDLAVTSGQAYRFSAYVYVVSNTGGLRLRINDGAGNSEATTIVTGTGVWARWDVAVTADATETWTFEFRQTAAGAHEAYFTAVLIEQSSTLGTFFDGSSPGGAWTGTPDASTSTSGLLPNRVGSLAPFYTASGTKQLIAGCGTRLEAVNTSGAVVASLTGLTDGIWDFARFGAPGAEYVYAGQGNQTLKRWDGTSWTTVASTPQGGALAVMAVAQGNRLVVGRFNTTTGGPSGGAGTSNPSRVHFSDPGAPETWGVNNYVDFTPGDGEAIQAIIAWREFVFVFKETKFFVVYGSHEDSAGQPVFDWRAVDTGIGLVSPRAIASDETGVYFMGRSGVYRTTGGDPEHLSAPVEPIFLGESSDYYQGGELEHSAITNCAMGAHENRIYLAYPTASANDRLLVYDTHAEWWSLWDIPASCLASFRVSSQDELVFGYASGDNAIGRHSTAYTNDADEAITSRWRSGHFDYDLSTMKTIRESKLWGSGKVYVGVSPDFQLGTGDLDEVDFTDPGTAEFWQSGFWQIGSWSGASVVAFNPRLRRRAVRGTTFSTSLSNSTLDQSWAVHRLTHHLREARIPSVRKVEA